MSIEEKELRGVLSKMGFAFEFLKVLIHAVLKKDGEVGDLRRVMNEPELADRIADLIVGKKNDVQSKSTDVILVPDLSAAGLVARAKEEIDLTYFNPELATWDFVTDERGKKYEVMTWAPGRSVSTAEVRAHFREKGFGGNTAAFISWLSKRQPMGWHMSIPEEDTRLWRGPRSGYLDAPCFDRGGGSRELGLRDVRGGWGGDCTFVAFREVPPA